jgi:CRP/FNR family transcriptional regulator
MCRVAGLGSKEACLMESIVERRVPVAEGEGLVAAGDAFEHLYAVKSGAFKTVARTPDGNEQIVAFHLPGDIIGVEAVGTRRHTYDVVALNDSRACRLNYRALQALQPQMPEFQQALIEAMSRRILHDQWMSGLLGTQTAERRIAAFVLSVSVRLDDRDLPGSQFRLPMSREDIANYLGLAVETVSRTLKQLHHRGVLMARGRNTQIKERVELEALANFKPVWVAAY